MMEGDCAPKIYQRQFPRKRLRLTRQAALVGG
jgi:hypothetical protein